MLDFLSVISYHLHLIYHLIFHLIYVISFVISFSSHLPSNFPSTISFSYHLSSHLIYPFSEKGMLNIHLMQLLMFHFLFWLMMVSCEMRWKMKDERDDALISFSQITYLLPSSKNQKISHSFNQSI